MKENLDADRLLIEFEQLVDTYRETMLNLEPVALRLLAAHVLAFAPEATHMRIETSDQGRYMCAPHGIEENGKDLIVGVEGDWEEVVEVNDLDAVASWLTWDGDWALYADHDHPYHNAHGGYFALDLRRIAADA